MIVLFCSNPGTKLCQQTQRRNTQLLKTRQPTAPTEGIGPAEKLNNHHDANGPVTKTTTPARFHSNTTKHQHHNSCTKHHSNHHCVLPARLMTTPLLTNLGGSNFTISNPPTQTNGAQTDCCDFVKTTMTCDLPFKPRGPGQKCCVKHNDETPNCSKCVNQLPQRRIGPAGKQQPRRKGVGDQNDNLCPIPVHQISVRVSA